jgi:hypothetical protein
MCETRPINQQKEFKYDQEFGITLSNPSNSWDLYLSERQNIENSQEPIRLSGNDRRRRIP